MDYQYSIEVTKTQAHVIQKALEIYARLGLGQFRDALDCLPLDISGKYESWFEVKQEIGGILRNHTKDNVDGWQSSLGIMSADVSDNSRIAWDIYQSVRKELHPSERGVFKVSDEPMVKITKLKEV